MGAENCGRFDCLPCTSEGLGSCRSVGVNYDIYCCECEEIDDEKLYHGQTARTGYIRGEEHLEDVEVTNVTNSTNVITSTNVTNSGHKCNKFHKCNKNFPQM